MDRPSGMNNPRIQVALPPPAQLRLTQLNIERDSALAQASSLQSRINACDGTTDALILERLTAEQQKARDRNNTLHRLLSAMQQWWFQLRLRPGEAIKSVTMVAKLPQGQTPAEAIGKLRVEMLAIAQELAKVRHAPLPVADQIAAAEKYVAQRGAVNGPRINVVRDQLQLQWPDDVIASKTDLIGMLCWLAPTSVIAALKREIEQSPASANALPAAERDARVADLESRLLDLERRESALLDKDTSILPRFDMDPRAYLQVEIVAREAQQQVA
jgi:hypothetical protein